MKLRNRRALSLLLVLVMLTGLLSAAASAQAISFTDVPANAWYYRDVQKAVDTGLIHGYPDNTFGPDKNLTYAEAILLAATMHRRAATGSTEFEAGSPWYQPYVDYAKGAGIISRDYDWNQPATRAGYMGIFANAIPDVPALATISPLTPINDVPDGSIPDVPMTHPQAAAIYKLYRAGIVVGSDAQHNCMPNSNIRRCEVAAVLTRMMNGAERMSLSLGQQPADGQGPSGTEKPAEALKFTAQPQNATVKTGENAGFSAAVSGGKAPYSFQWFFRNADELFFTRCDTLPGWEELFSITSKDGVSVLTVSQAGVRMKQDGAVYICVVTDADGKTEQSEAAILTVVDSR